MGTTVLILLPAIVFLFADAERSPSLQKLKLCNQNSNDTDVDECNRSAVEMALRKFKDENEIFHQLYVSVILQKYSSLTLRLPKQHRVFKEAGDEELGISPYDPIFVPMAKLSQGTGSQDFALTITECEVEGIISCNVISVKMSTEDHGFMMKGLTPAIVLKGNYETSGKIVGLAIRGKGKITLAMLNATTTTSYKGSFDKKGCKLYLKLTNFSIQLDPETTTFNLTNLYDGNEALANATLRILNEFHKDLYAMMKTSVDEVLADIFRPLYQKFYNTVAYDDLFPEFKMPCPEELT